MSCEIKLLAKLSDLNYVQEVLGFSQGKEQKRNFFLFSDGRNVIIIIVVFICFVIYIFFLFTNHSFDQMKIGSIRCSIRYRRRVKY